MEHNTNARSSDGFVAPYCVKKAGEVNSNQSETTKHAGLPFSTGF